MSLDFLAEDLLLALATFGLFFIAGIVFYWILRVATSRLRRQDPNGLAYRVTLGIRTPAVLSIIFIGAFLALTYLDALGSWQNTMRNVWTILLVLLATRAITKTVNAAANWYSQTVAPRTTTKVDNKMAPVLRRIVLVTVYGLAALISLDTLGVSISPLLGGLGITGLAVALALQPTLSNFFAGTYVLTDTAIQPGDYIELQGGPAGYVIDIGWRSTKIRTWLNNLVIVPNSIVSDSIVTNYQGPDPAINILVTCGVSYESDLEHVEHVALEVAREVLDGIPEAIREVDPFFGYDNFGDSNIEFWIFLQAKDRIGSFIVTSELIKRLHARFSKENIEINYPVRKLVYPNPESRPGS